MVFLAFLILFLCAAMLIKEVADEPPARIVGMLVAIAVFMATPWAFMTVVRWFSGGAP